jgi:hypothetical protein
MKITGADEETLKLCPPQDTECVHALGLIMLGVWAYQAALFSLSGYHLFASSWFRPDIVLGAAFAATFILAIDSFVIMRSGWFLEGIQELKRGGIDISGGRKERLKTYSFLGIRIGLLSIGIAQLTAIFVSLLIFMGDINARIDESYLTANERVIGPAAALIDADIRRATDAVNAQTARANAVAAQIGVLRQNEIDPLANDPQIRRAQEEVTQLAAQKAKADEEVRSAESFAADEYGGIKRAPGNSGQPGFGLRYRAAMEQVNKAKARAQDLDAKLNAARDRLETLRQQLSSSSDKVMQRAHDQLGGFEQTLNAENAKLAALKRELAQLTAGRETALRTAIENAPDHVARDDGFLAQIVVLEHMAEKDSKIAAVILLIDLVSFGFELAAVLAKVTSFVPTSYAALLARDAYMRAVRMADEIMIELKTMETRGQSEPEGMHEPLEHDQDVGFVPAAAPGELNNPTAPQVKRGRGRPRKYPLPDEVLKGANGRGDSKPSAGQAAPA